jgi:hypothetical protein
VLDDFQVGDCINWVKNNLGKVMRSLISGEVNVILLFAHLELVVDVLVPGTPSNWYDIDGHEYTCAWYAQSIRCLRHGD